MSGRDTIDFTTFAATLKQPALQSLHKEKLDTYPQLIKVILIGGTATLTDAFAIIAEKLRSHQDLLLLTATDANAIHHSLPNVDVQYIHSV